MKAVILAGGYGTRISEETTVKPKPMVEIGGKPILQHIMKIYSSHGINDFIICLGYKGYVIKEYFANYFLHTSDVTFDLRGNKLVTLKANSEPWKVTLVDTGEDTMTGGRLKHVAQYLDEDEPFCFTYGDGVADINVSETIAFHKAHGKLATVTAVQPPGRFGVIRFSGTRVERFEEKPSGDGAWISAGFFILSKQVIDCIDGPQTTWEREPMETLAREGEMQAYFHRGFWQPMDTLRDKQKLEELWASGKAPWKSW